MKKQYDAYVVGYYGMKNSGDDALLAATLLGSQRFLGASNTLVSNAGVLAQSRFGDRPTNLKQVQAFTGQNRLIHYFNAVRCRRVIFGGGSVLHSEQDINIKRAMMYLTGSQKALALGIGIEPFKTQSAKVACKKFLNQCGMVAVRDDDSYKLATSIAPHANIIKSFDLAPLLITHPEHQPNYGHRRGVVVNVCPAPTDAIGTTDPCAERERLLQLAEIIEQVWSLSGEPIYLMHFNGHDTLGDVQVSQQLQQLLHGKVPLQVIPYNPDPIAVLNSVSKFKLMLGMRLHANIFAFLTDTPAINLSYHPKSFAWAEQIGLSPDYVFDAHQIDRARLYNAVMNALSTGQLGTTFTHHQALEQTMKNWSMYYERHTNIGCHPAFQ